LSAGSPDRYSEAFRKGLRDLGWVEGENIAVEWRWAGGKSERLPELVTEFLRTKPSVILTFTTPATQAAVTATTRIPIVFNAVADPVGSGFVASLARPGGNVTGLTFVPELDFFGKQLELLKQVVPGISRVAIMWAATNPVHLVIADLLFFVNRRSLADMAANARVPTMYGARGHVEAGGLTSLLAGAAGSAAAGCRLR
jgi:ABC-type uncharacterized transport system substrate-binding protein